MQNFIQHTFKIFHFKLYYRFHSQSHNLCYFDFYNYPTFYSTITTSFSQPKQKVSIIFNLTYPPLKDPRIFTLIKLMLKSASEMHFQQLSENLDKQLEILSERISRIISFQKINIHFDTYSDLNAKIKSLNSVLSKIQMQMKMKAKDKNYNQYDLRQRLRKYYQCRQKLVTKYESIGKLVQEIKKKYLIDKGQGITSDPLRRQIEMKNMNKANELISRYHGVNDDLKQTQQITTAWIPELHNQGNVIHQMKTDTHDMEQQLGMVDQLMRIIKNRNLYTKLLLIVMIALMGIVDILLIALKLTR